MQNKCHKLRFVAWEALNLSPEAGVHTSVDTAR